MTVTKDKIIHSVQKTCGTPKEDSTRLVDSLFSIMKDTLANGDDILISRFGKFYVKDKKARRGRSPKTGNELTLDARRVVLFRCSPLLKDKINTNPE
jgi:integration host factor subunit alpha